MKFLIKYTSIFKKDLKHAKKQGKDLGKLFGVIEKLANNQPLDKRFLDHELTGNFKDKRECHVESNWLLIYKIDIRLLVLMLYRIGTHSELFK